jgi:CheY-like chemotaxis protein
MPQKVLIVEDNLDTAESLRTLVELWGHEVRVAFNGLDGLAVAKEWQPDTVLCDIGLPGLDGFAVARSLQPSGTRLIAITGYGSASFRRTALASGFEEILVKPANPNALERLLAVS